MHWLVSSDQSHPSSQTHCSPMSSPCPQSYRNTMQYGRRLPLGQSLQRKLRAAAVATAADRDDAVCRRRRLLSICCCCCSATLATGALPETSTTTTRGAGVVDSLVVLIPAASETVVVMAGAAVATSLLSLLVVVSSSIGVPGKQSWGGIGGRRRHSPLPGSTTPSLQSGSWLKS